MGPRFGSSSQSLDFDAFEAGDTTGIVDPSLSEILPEIGWVRIAELKIFGLVAGSIFAFDIGPDARDDEALGVHMRSAKQIVVNLVAAVIVAGIPLAAAYAQTSDSPQLLLKQWQAALERGDYPAYVECLHTGTRQVPEYGSEEAMAFWTNEMDDLRRMGFSGQFDISVVTDGGPRFPEGSIRAYPIVNGQPIREAIVLIKEAGHWKILRLFS
jgi:hypothetical protein